MQLLYSSCLIKHFSYTFFYLRHLLDNKSSSCLTLSVCWSIWKTFGCINCIIWKYYDFSKLNFAHKFYTHQWCAPPILETFYVMTFFSKLSPVITYTCMQNNCLWNSITSCMEMPQGIASVDLVSFPYTWYAHVT